MKTPKRPSFSEEEKRADSKRYFFFNFKIYKKRVKGVIDGQDSSTS